MHLTMSSSSSALRLLVAEKKTNYAPLIQSLLENRIKAALFLDALIDRTEELKRSNVKAASLKSYLKKADAFVDLHLVPIAYGPLDLERNRPQGLDGGWIKDGLKVSSLQDLRMSDVELLRPLALGEQIALFPASNEELSSRKLTPEAVEWFMHCFDDYSRNRFRPKPKEKDLDETRFALENMPQQADQEAIERFLNIAEKKNRLAYEGIVALRTRNLQKKVLRTNFKDFRVLLREIPELSAYDNLVDDEPLGVIARLMQKGDRLAFGYDDSETRRTEAPEIRSYRINLGRILIGKLIQLANIMNAMGYVSHEAIGYPDGKVGIIGGNMLSDEEFNKKTVSRMRSFDPMMYISRATVASIEATLQAMQTDQNSRSEDLPFLQNFFSIPTPPVQLSRMDEKPRMMLPVLSEEDSKRLIMQLNAAAPVSPSGSPTSSPPRRRLFGEGTSVTGSGTFATIPVTFTRPTTTTTSFPPRPEVRKKKSYYGGMDPFPEEDDGISSYAPLSDADLAPLLGEVGTLTLELYPPDKLVGPARYLANPFDLYIRANRETLQAKMKGKKTAKDTIPVTQRFSSDRLRNLLESDQVRDSIDKANKTYKVVEKVLIDNKKATDAMIQFAVPEPKAEEQIKSLAGLFMADYQMGVFQWTTTHKAYLTNRGEGFKKSLESAVLSRYAAETQLQASNLDQVLDEERVKLSKMVQEAFGSALEVFTVDPDAPIEFDNQGSANLEAAIRTHVLDKASMLKGFVKAIAAYNQSSLEPYSGGKELVKASLNDAVFKLLDNRSTPDSIKRRAETIRKTLPTNLPVQAQLDLVNQLRKIETDSGDKFIQSYRELNKRAVSRRNGLVQDLYKHLLEAKVGTGEAIRAGRKKPLALEGAGAAEFLQTAVNYLYKNLLSNKDIVKDIDSIVKRTEEYEKQRDSFVKQLDQVEAQVQTLSMANAGPTKRLAVENESNRSLIQSIQASLRAMTAKPGVASVTLETLVTESTLKTVQKLTSLILASNELPSSALRGYVAAFVHDPNFKTAAADRLLAKSDSALLALLQARDDHLLHPNFLFFATLLVERSLDKILTLLNNLALARLNALAGTSDWSSAPTAPELDVSKNTDAIYQVLTQERTRRLDQELDGNVAQFIRTAQELLGKIANERRRSVMEALDKLDSTLSDYREAGIRDVPFSLDADVTTPFKPFLADEPLANVVMPKGVTDLLEHWQTFIEGTTRIALMAHRHLPIWREKSPNLKVSVQANPRPSGVCALETYLRLTEGKTLLTTSYYGRIEALYQVNQQRNQSFMNGDLLSTTGSAEQALVEKEEGDFIQFWSENRTEILEGRLPYAALVALSVDHSRLGDTEFDVTGRHTADLIRNLVGIQGGGVRGENSIDWDPELRILGRYTSKAFVEAIQTARSRTCRDVIYRVIIGKKLADATRDSGGIPTLVQSTLALNILAAYEKLILEDNYKALTKYITAPPINKNDMFMDRWFEEQSFGSYLRYQLASDLQLFFGEQLESSGVFEDLIRGLKRFTSALVDQINEVALDLLVKQLPKVLLQARLQDLQTRRKVIRSMMLRSWHRTVQAYLGSQVTINLTTKALNNRNRILPMRDLSPAFVQKTLQVFQHLTADAAATSPPITGSDLRKIFIDDLKNFPYVLGLASDSSSAQRFLSQEDTGLWVMYDSYPTGGIKITMEPDSKTAPASSTDTAVTDVLKVDQKLASTAFDKFWTLLIRSNTNAEGTPLLLPNGFLTWDILRALFDQVKATFGDSFSAASTSAVVQSRSSILDQGQLKQDILTMAAAETASTTTDPDQVLSVPDPASAATVPHDPSWFNAQVASDLDRIRSLRRELNEQLEQWSNELAQATRKNDLAFQDLIAVVDRDPSAVRRDYLKKNYLGAVPNELLARSATARNRIQVQLKATELFEKVSPSQPLSLAQEEALVKLRKGGFQDMQDAITASSVVLTQAKEKVDADIRATVDAALTRLRVTAGQLETIRLSRFSDQQAEKLVEGVSDDDGGGGIRVQS